MREQGMNLKTNEISKQSKINITDVSRTRPTLLIVSLCTKIYSLSKRFLGMYHCLSVKLAGASHSGFIAYMLPFYFLKFFIFKYAQKLKRGLLLLLGLSKHTCLV